MEETSKKVFYFFSLGVAGKGISGGDRIFIEFARRWILKHKIIVYTSFEGGILIRTQNLKSSGVVAHVINNEKLVDNFLVNYLYKVIQGIILGLSLKLERSDLTNVYVYSCSEFWMDSLPSFLLKVRYSEIKWIAAWYQTAPNPLVGYSEGNRKEKYNFKAALYWFMQLPIKPLISKFADSILINNESERKQFPLANRNGKVQVVVGAVDLEKITNYKLRNTNLPKVYDAVFQGRFHPQKGVVELVEIWKKVVEKRPKAKLAMIGDGPLMEDVKTKIKNLKLEKNINLFGYVFDGPEKYKIFSQSKIVVHPAFFDSGGMASAEAMAFDLPCVGFDLKSYVSYYPKGMVKIKIGNLDAFAKTVIELLVNDKRRNRIGKEASDMIKNNWSWDERAKEVLNKFI